MTDARDAGIGAQAVTPLRDFAPAEQGRALASFLSDGESHDVPIAEPSTVK
ncbi:hypothetical protein [Herbidospora cretacea]|uniref:hypothetical protein n=1 Tax=Herbidospora cretacea TaxID=28444 RepID=UPI000A7E1CC1|nr:hypothetical protein [Herbidospora cretacea]